MSYRSTILIADDSEINREVLAEIFRDHYLILEAKDGEEAIELLKLHASGILLVISDILMPRKTGFDVIAFMQSQGLLNEIPAVVITGSEDTEVELRAYDLGASEVLHKPFVPEIVNRRIQNVLELHKRQKELHAQIEQHTQVIENILRTDQLTGLLGKDRFLVACEEFLHYPSVEAEAEQYHISYFNIIGFKSYNMEFGVKKGDEVLRKTAGILLKYSTTKILGRLGSDHFIAISRTQEGHEKIHEVIRKFDAEYERYGLKLKAGIYGIRDVDQDIQIACDYAQTACDNIRDDLVDVREYDEQLAVALDRENYVWKFLDHAMEQSYIKVFFQPVVRTLNGKICGVEALARWIDPEKGFLSPGDFIPVLEKHQLITKLDLYILREVCRALKQREQEDKFLVPVSINLSRLDFINCDIFSEVENIVMEYGVARDMINIEITESTIMYDQERMKKTIKRFRDGGYQVWMDDFGSGYSTLNILKNFTFDEIKLDMQFLADFNEESKTIIRSVIKMAKELGIQTLAEGVETEEQFAFLKEIGCEKAQGFLFSRPLELPQLTQLCEEKHLELETRVWRDYYDRAGAVNFLTDRALSIAEYDGSRFDLLFVNKECKDIWQSLGLTGHGEVADNLNSPLFPVSRQLHELQKTVHAGEPAQEAVYSVHGQYMKVSIKCLAEQNGRSIDQVEVINMSNSENEEKREKLDRTFRMMYSMYDAIYLMDLKNNTYESLLHGSHFQLTGVDESFVNHQLNLSASAKAFIHPDDRREYLHFMEMSDLPERIMASKHGYLKNYFRTITSNHGYAWMAHTVLFDPEYETVIYNVQPAPLEEAVLIQKITPAVHPELVPNGNRDVQKAMCQAVKHSRIINLFWKDKDRRFLGANAKFMESYGLTSEEEFVGKTDEEMGWHVDEGPFMNDEWDVIHNGTIITNQIGTCIIKGVMHKILVSKQPLYDDGEIIGLMGFFIDLENLVDEKGNIMKSKGIDQVTGLLSVSGITNVVSDYIDGWVNRKVNFAAIRVELASSRRIALNYGDDILKSMLREYGGMLTELVGNNGSCGHIYGGSFVVLRQCTDKEDIRAFAELIRQKTTEIHSLAGYRATADCRIQIHFADETEHINSIVEIIFGGGQTIR